MMTRRRRFHLLLALVSPACGGGDLALPTDPPAAQLEMVQGDEQVGPPGTPLRDPLIVRVTDSTGDPLAGQAVTWSVNGGGGAIDPVTDSSNAEGLAFAEWILGPSPGLNVVEAQVAGSDLVTFTARAEGGGDDDDTDTGPARLALVEGTGQSAEAGSPVPVRPAVLVTDSAGEPVAGVAVTFVVTAGGGGVRGGAQTTGSDGVARVDRWTLGAEPGTNTLEARSGSLAGSPVVFTAQGTEPEPEPGPEPDVDRLVFLTPPPAQVGVNETFRISVALVDADGDVVPLTGIFIYLALFEEGRESPTNDLVTGERFENTDDGVAEFDLGVDGRGRYRIRALTDDLPELGPHGPEPWLYSPVFEVR